MASFTDRRSFLSAALGSLALIPASTRAQSQAVSPVPSTRNYAGGPPVQYPDPDVIALDKRFQRYIVGNTVIKRHYTGTFWSEGPAWNGVGRFLVWSDIPNNVQMRWREEDNTVSVFRNPSGYSNGNTFDYEGRQLSCEHGGRRVARYEYNGTVTVIADKFEGKRLNSPNDIVVHPDGGVWFTDPIYGILGNYEGFKAQSELKPAVYRVDGKTGQMDKVADEPDAPNGICFSPDYKKVYVADTGNARANLDLSTWTASPCATEAFCATERSGDRSAHGSRRHALRYRWQPMVRRASRGASSYAQRRTHRHDPPAGELRQRVLRRHQAQPAVHGRESVTLQRLRGHARRAHRLISA